MDRELDVKLLVPTEFNVNNLNKINGCPADFQMSEFLPPRVLEDLAEVFL